ncbi:hypothetical protein K466DRAFT_662422 [Polyporus arcularius HHB13444]|uniref:MYND-type domain-containing protein n=1 Tax=Polyporus arcularius HHB13444 TaxID=1314778 RepID=A0A5C3PGD9_9APHY|nr:hypothetical protein K466DRAFT_662422 [Polyporus arcularius HHB13444]
MTSRNLYTSSSRAPIICGSYSAVAPPQLRTCEWCSKAPRELRRCVACNTALYCDRECQKAAWKRHKTSCKVIANTVTGQPHEEFVLAELRRIGFSSLADFSEALADFKEAHSWAIASIVQAAIHREGVLDWMQNKGTTEALCFRLAPLSPRERRIHRDPGSAFRIKSVEFSASEIVDDMREFRSGFNFASHAERAQNLDYVGAALVLYDVEGLTMKISGTYAQYRPTAPELASPEEQRAIFGDMMMLCVGCINMGCPLRVLEGNDPIVALPGRFSRVRGKWTWKPLFSSWEDYRGGDAGLDEVLGRLKLSHVSPAQLMTAVSRL